MLTSCLSRMQLFTSTLKDGLHLMEKRVAGCSLSCAGESLHLEEMTSELHLKHLTYLLLLTSPGTAHHFLVCDAVGDLLAFLKDGPADSDRTLCTDKPDPNGPSVYRRVHGRGSWQLIIRFKSSFVGDESEKIFQLHLKIPLG